MIHSLFRWKRSVVATVMTIIPENPTVNSCIVPEEDEKEEKSNGRARRQRNDCCSQNCRGKRKVQSNIVKMLNTSVKSRIKRMRATVKAKGGCSRLADDVTKSNEFSPPTFLNSIAFGTSTGQYMGKTRRKELVLMYVTTSRRN